MNTVILLQKLTEIELALDRGESATLRKMLHDAQQCALQLQRESPEQRRRDSRCVFAN
jgi:hypothetical protein